MRTASNQKGTTMVETIMYVSFMIILGSILGSYVGSAFRRYRTGRAAQQVLEIKKAIMQYTAAAEDYRELTLENMKKDKALPLDAKNGFHALGGAIKIGPTMDASISHVSEALHSSTTIPLGCEDPTLNPFQFYITFESVFSRACIELLTQGQYFNDSGDLDTIIVNNKTIWQYDYSFINLADVGGLKKITMKSSKGNLSNRPLIKDATEACFEKEKNTITWVFS